MFYLAVLSDNPPSLPDVAGVWKSGLGREERATDTEQRVGTGGTAQKDALRKRT